MSNSQKVLTRDEADKLMGEHVIIPEGYTEIEYRAFLNRTDIVHLEIPASIKKIDAWAWANKSSQMARISVDPENMYYSSLEGVLFNKDGTELFSCPPKKEGDAYTIPTGVTKIGIGAFYGCKTLKQIILPEGISNIEDRAFCACYQLMHINIPDTIKYINSEVFLSCWDLKEITLPPDIKEIGGEAFRACRKTTDLTVIEKPEFDKCEKIVFIPDGSKGLVIRCYKDSVAHKYALENNLDFELISV